MKLMNPGSAELESFEIEILKTLKRNLDRRTSGPVFRPSLREADTDRLGFSRRFIDLVTLLTLCHYGTLLDPFELYFRLAVQDYVERNLLFPELHASATSRQVFLQVIQGRISPKMNTNVFFGSCLSVETVDRVIRLIKIPKRPITRIRQLVRRRGYKDHGSLRPKHHWRESHDSTWTDLQNKLESRRSSYLDIVSSLLLAVQGSRGTAEFNFDLIRKEVDEWHLKQNEII